MVNMTRDYALIARSLIRPAYFTLPQETGKAENLA
jgi:hypothetical protein